MAIYSAILGGLLVGTLIALAVYTCVRSHQVIELEKERLRIENDKLELEEAKFLSSPFKYMGE